MSAKRLILAAAPLAIAVSLILAPDYPDLKDVTGYGLRVTARIAFCFFILAYIARPLMQLTGSGRWLVANRRYLGLSAAFTHTVHFFYVVANLRVTGEALDPIVLVFGGLAFVFFWLMAATSNKPSIRRLGPWWKRLHTTGMHYIWIIFAQSYIPRALEEPAYWLLAGPAVAAALLRLTAFLHKRRRVAPTPA
ncbi:MAG: hypothetical protein H6993_10160 [Pseudomonadales bacterium]|nr:hypothetical protein [Pseudomonadales bacterium]